MFEDLLRRQSAIQHHKIRLRIDPTKHSGIRLIEEFLTVIPVVLSYPGDELLVLQRSSGRPGAKNAYSPLQLAGAEFLRGFRRSD